jgi:hypothetical protein
MDERQGVGSGPRHDIAGSQRSPHGERKVGAGLRHALGHDVVAPLPLATIRRPGRADHPWSAARLSGPLNPTQCRRMRCHRIPTQYSPQALLPSCPRALRPTYPY